MPGEDFLRRGVVADAREDGPTTGYAGVGSGQEEDVVADVEEQAEYVGATDDGQRSVLQIEPHPRLFEGRRGRIPEDCVGVVGIGDHALDAAGEHDAPARRFLRTTFRGVPAVGDR